MVANPCPESWQSLHQQLRGIAKRRAALDAEEARCLRDADAMKLWRRLGYVHMAEYLERELGYGPQVAAERLRVARELGELPQTEAGLAAGTLSYSAIRELTRIATADTENEWLAESRGKNLRQIEAMVSGRKRGDRPCDPTRPDLVARVVRIELLPHVFALFRQAQGAMADEHGGTLDDNAFIEALCRRALEGEGTSARPPHQIAITVCESCKRGWQNGGGQEIEVGAEVIARAECDAEWIGSLEAEQPTRVTASVTPRIRRQVLARDHHRCTVPGCRSARNLDLHHIEYQCEGGTHELWNITTTCSGHHRQLHEGALTIRGKAPDALDFAWRDGTASWGDEPDADHERGETTPAVALGVGNPAVERLTMGDMAAPTDQDASARGRFALGQYSAGDRREAETADDLHSERASEKPTICDALASTENTARDVRTPMTAKPEVEYPTDQDDSARGIPATGACSAVHVREPATTSERHNDCAIENPTIRGALAATENTAGDVREPMTDKFHVGDQTAKGHGSDCALATGGCDVRDVREPMTDNFHVGDRTAKGHGSGSALATGGCDVRDVREPMTDNFHVGDRTAKGHGSGSALATGGCDVRDVREPMTDKPHVGDPATVGTTTDKVTTATRRVAHEARPATAVASSRTGDDATLTHLLRDAREALTTAGYKAHEARAAVEIARSEFDDDVTLPLLIRKALQCCARARTA